MRQLATDNAIGHSTAYDLHDGIDVLTVEAPDLATTLDEARASGSGHLNLGGSAPSSKSPTSSYDWSHGRPHRTHHTAS